MPKSNEEPQASILTEIPEGFTVHVGPGGKEYLVPQYMIPALDQAFAAYHHKAELNILSTQPQVRQILYICSAPLSLCWLGDAIYISALRWRRGTN